MKVIAHRGASGCAPENTLAAFRRAAEMGAGFIETDLQLTRDGRLVAIHDETLDRTTNGTGPVSAATFEELRKLDAGAWFWKKDAGRVQHSDSVGECIPTVEEVLAFGRESNVGLYLEMKMPGARGAEHVLAEALQAAHYLDRTVVISFDREALARVREIEPSIPTGYLYSDRRTDGVAEALRAGATQLLPRADRITRKLLEQAHGSNLEVIAWTVNATRRMKELLVLGVDGIITNFPNSLAALLSTPD
jgi:glycerophosphoryl diester phosphodiesterase